MYLWVSGIKCASIYDTCISIAFWKFFDIVVFFVFHFIFRYAPVENKDERYSYICYGACLRRWGPTLLLFVKPAVCCRVYLNSRE